MMIVGKRLAGPDHLTDYKPQYSAPSFPTASTTQEGVGYLNRQRSEEAQPPTVGIGNDLSKHARNRDQAKAAADFAGNFS